VFDSPTTVREYLKLQLADLAHEVFAVLFLDAQHRLIAYEPLFRGTLTQTSVYRARRSSAPWRSTPRRCCWRTTIPRAWPSPRGPTSF